MKLGESKIFKSPYFVALFIAVAMGIYLGLSYICRAISGPFDIQEVGTTEVLTYLFYGFGGGIIACYAKDFMTDKSKIQTFSAIAFLYFSARSSAHSSTLSSLVRSLLWRRSASFTAFATGFVLISLT